MKKTKGTFQSLFANAMTAAALTGLFLLANMRTGRRVVLLLGDGLTIAGVILLIFAFFRWGLRKGYFNWLEYGLYVGRFLLTGKKDEGFLNFYDFGTSREYSDTPLWTACAVAGCCIAVGAVMVCFAAAGLP